MKFFFIYKYIISLKKVSEPAVHDYKDHHYLSKSLQAWNLQGK